MSRRARSVAFAVTCAALPVAAAPAAAKPDNVGATKRFLAAYETRERTIVRKLPAVGVEVRAWSGTVARECPRSAGGAALGAASTEEMREEILGAAVVTSAESLKPANRRFARAVNVLRWSNRSIARLVRDFIAEEKTLAGLQLPSICSDVRSWASSGYLTVPTTTSGFLSRAHATEPKPKPGGRPPEEPDESILGLIRPYESRADHGVLREIKRLKATVEAGLLTDVVLPAAQTLSALAFPS